jgi:hypothetical protein
LPNEPSIQKDSDKTELSVIFQQYYATNKNKTIFTGVKLMTVTVIMVIPRWRMWNQVRIFFAD